MVMRTLSAVAAVVPAVCAWVYNSLMVMVSIRGLLPMSPIMTIVRLSM